MQSQYIKNELSGGVSLAQIYDTKFKSNTVTVRFLTDINQEDAAALTIIPSVLTSCNAKYPVGVDFVKKLNALYGTVVSGYASVMGDTFEIKLTCNHIMDKYALDGDKISLEAGQILLDCIFMPALEGDGFAVSEFEARKKDLLDTIDGEINDKISYAMQLALETAYIGEPSAQKHYGSREAVEALTPEKAYKVYLKLLSEAKIEISFCGGGDFEESVELFEKAFNTSRAKWKTPQIISYSPAKQETAYAEKAMNVMQANLVLAFKPKSYNQAVFEILCGLYGGTASSKLFMNVREKMSLCYFCSSIYSVNKGTMFVVSAVEFSNVEKAKDEIIRQLSLIAEGDFTDSELENTKLSLASSVESRNDRISNIDNWYYLASARGELITPDEYINRLYSVTREDVTLLAKEFTLDTVFILKNSEEK